MTDEMKFAIEVGMRVMVKVAAREIPATVIEVREDCFIVKSETTGKEFRTSRVVDILDPHDGTDIAEEAEAVLEKQDAAGKLRRIEEDEANPPPSTMPGTDVNDAAADEDRQENDAMQEEQKEEAVAVNSQDADEAMETTVAVEEHSGDKAEDAPAGDAAAESADQPTEAEAAPGEETASEDENAGQPAGEIETEAASAGRPKKNLSLVDAAVEVLKAEKRPMNVREMVKLAVERGLWIPTKCKTPEQSLYGGLYLDMKNSAAPRVKKSAEKGKFELA